MANKSNVKPKRKRSTKEIALWLALGANLLQVFSAAAVLVKHIWKEKKELKTRER